MRYPDHVYQYHAMYNDQRSDDDLTGPADDEKGRWGNGEADGMGGFGGKRWDGMRLGVYVLYFLYYSVRREVAHCVCVCEGSDS